MILMFQLVVVARRLLRNGYAFEDIRTALLAEAQVQREEADEIQQRRWIRRLDTLWHRLWAGRFGRFFSGSRAWGSRPPSAAPSPRPTRRSWCWDGRCSRSTRRWRRPSGTRCGTSGGVERLEKEAEALRAAARRASASPRPWPPWRRAPRAPQAAAGTGTVGDLTLWLERAREIGAVVDRRVAAEGEVKQLLGE